MFIIDAARRVKRDRPDHIVLIRTGDFYEAFDQDAQTVADVLAVGVFSLTGVPMAGFPAAVVTERIARLTAAGHKVAVLEQGETTAVEAADGP